VNRRRKKARARRKIRQVGLPVFCLAMFAARLAGDAPGPTDADVEVMARAGLAALGVLALGGATHVLVWCLAARPF
jgi:hypothetical protein